MAKQIINIGTLPNDRTGDPLRVSFEKINENFTELYDAKLTFPTLTVPISDNSTPSGTGQTLKFIDGSQQAIIYGPPSTPSYNSADRIIIQGAPGYTGTSGEGGDLYLWAGPGGDTDGNGGDIKIRAGRGNGDGGGGYLNFQAGNSNTGNGGYINIESGSSGTSGSGGDITVQARQGGEITLRTYQDGTSNNWLFSAAGDIILPRSSVLSETVNSIVITPPGAIPGQSLAIRPTSSLWSVTSSGYIEYGNLITITVSQNNYGNYFGTINYEFTGPGVTEQSLGRPLNGNVVITTGMGGSQANIEWIIPANSDINEFTFTLTTVDGTRSNDINTENDPSLYYSFEYNAMPTGNFVTVTNNGITNSEESHIHIVAGDPSTTDIYLGDDDSYVKIQKNGGNIVIATDTNTNLWSFDTYGMLTFPDNSIQTTAWTGGVPPATSKGTIGDKIGMIASDSGYLYICIANYTDGNDDIWSRNPVSASTWP